MILVDSSVWIDYLRHGNGRLAALLVKSEVWTHPFVIGELACGNLANRSELLMLMSNLPRLVTATEDEVLFYIEQHRLMGRGIGYIDAHLLAASALASPVRLWTRDRRLARVADELGLRE
jgi:predicted nucleic acid-binding protein